MLEILPWLSVIDLLARLAIRLLAVVHVSLALLRCTIGLLVLTLGILLILKLVLRLTLSRLLIRLAIGLGLASAVGLSLRPAAILLLTAVPQLAALLLVATLQLLIGLIIHLRPYSHLGTPIPNRIEITRPSLAR